MKRIHKYYLKSRYNTNNIISKSIYIERDLILKSSCFFKKKSFSGINNIPSGHFETHSFFLFLVLFSQLSLPSRSNNNNWVCVVHNVALSQWDAHSFPFIHSSFFSRVRLILYICIICTFQKYITRQYYKIDIHIYIYIYI